MEIFNKSAGEWLALTNQLRIWGAALAAVAGIIAFGANWAQVELQKLVSKQKDEELARYKAEADERVSRNERLAAEAAERAAKANEGAAQANERAAQLEKERLELEGRLAPRRLSSRTKSDLAQKMGAFKGQRISLSCNMSDAESQSLCMELVDIFRAAGWRGCENLGYSQFISSPIPKGLEVTVSQDVQDASDAPAAALALMQTLTQVGLIKTNMIVRSDRIPSGEIGLHVGRKEDIA